jgi:hypothetical protein
MDTQIFLGESETAFFILDQLKVRTKRKGKKKRINKILVGLGKTKLKAKRKCHCQNFNRVVSCWLLWQKKKKIEG